MELGAKNLHDTPQKQDKVILHGDSSASLLRK